MPAIPDKVERAIPAIPDEAKRAIMVYSVQNVKGREAQGRWKVVLALVNRNFRDVLYDADELWNTVFVHYAMDFKYIRHICNRAKKSARAPILRISTEAEREPGEKELVGCRLFKKIARWAFMLGFMLVPVVKKAISIQVNSADPHAMSIILRHVGITQARALERFTCFAAMVEPDDSNSLYPLHSRGLRLLSISHVNPAGLAPIQFHGLTKLQLLSIKKKLEWFEMRIILTSCMALEELEVAGVVCTGAVGTRKILLAYLWHLNLDIAELGALDFATVLDLPALRKLTVRGEAHSPWTAFTDSLRPSLERVNECVLSAADYTEGVASLLAAMPAVEVIDLRQGNDEFVSSMTDDEDTDDVDRPPLAHLKRWITTSHLSYFQADALTNWPGATDVLLYTEMDDGGAYKFAEWEQDDEVYTVTLVHDKPGF
ncbi:hypothetical protein R3P38DRAFT_3228192 [Favolaschia claudopus]|uniref:F-box domain-containing protein n=1 Tax=Favolaschia claudopus TaxID=2862362 RepID=A0AAV9ZRB9_9AGAR